jgi:hypothetical protein
MEVGNIIWNTSHVGYLFQISMDVELIKRFCPVGLTRWWSDRLVVNLIPKSLELHFGQGVLYGDLQRLDYILGDMHTPTLKIMEDMEFQIGLIVKLNWRNCRLEFELYSSVWTIETNTFRHH